jgi:hypothetical protein
VDVLIHKVTDFIAAAENGDLQAFKAVQKIEVVQKSNINICSQLVLCAEARLQS